MIHKIALLNSIKNQINIKVLIHSINQQNQYQLKLHKNISIPININIHKYNQIKMFKIKIMDIQNGHMIIKFNQHYKNKHKHKKN